MTAPPRFDIGALIRARGREWVVLPESSEDPDLLVLRPLGGTDDEITGNSVRMLIADDVGIGKIIEACTIARELLDRDEIRGLAVRCPRQLAEQVQDGEADRSRGKVRSGEDTNLSSYRGGFRCRSGAARCSERLWHGKRRSKTEPSPASEANRHTSGPSNASRGPYARTGAAVPIMTAVQTKNPPTRIPAVMYT